MASFCKKANILGDREPEDNLNTKSFMRKHKEKIKGRVELLETKSDQANLISPKELAARNKSLFVSDLPHQTKILDIINFFNDVGKVVRVRLVVDHVGNHVRCGFVEFASTDQAEKALKKKEKEYFLDQLIYIALVKIIPYPPPKYCIDHKVCYKDRLLIGEDETLQGLVETPESLEDVTARKKTLFVANLSPQTTIPDIDNFFKDVGEEDDKFFHIIGGDVRVRLIVNHWGTLVGCAFVEFTSANKAKKALEEKNGVYLCGRKVLLQEAEIDP